MSCSVVILTESGIDVRMRDNHVEEVDRNFPTIDSEIINCRKSANSPIV